MTKQLPLYRALLFAATMLLPAACASTGTMDSSPADDTVDDTGSNSGNNAVSNNVDSGGFVVRLPSENFNSRVSIIVIHHTTEDFASSVKILTKRSSRSVSSHYLIPEPDDPTYTDEELKVYELVPETARAWHAGRSFWAGKTALNDQSIGIELVNKTYCRKNGNGVEIGIENGSAVPNGNGDDGNGSAEDAVDDGETWPAQLCFYPDFPKPQVELLIGLLADIHERHPGINPVNVVGHADIAPGRRIDPGPRFPWERLYRLGYGAWYDDETLAKYWELFLEKPLPLKTIQKALAVYGYGIEATGEMDKQTHDTLRAFQMHFRPSLVTAAQNAESDAALFALIEKYFPGELEGLLAGAEEDGKAADAPVTTKP